MDMNTILSAVSKMFPSANLNGAVQKAREIMQGTPDTLSGASSVARQMGIDRAFINDMFNRYGNTMQARTICSMFGTTPEALRKDAEKIVSGSVPPSSQPNNSTRFPRLK